MSADDTTNDVGSWVTVLARNWWVIAGLIVLGAVVGALLTLTSPKVYTATSSVYIGQTTDANGTPMAGLNSNIKASTQLVSSQAVLNEAAKRAGMGITAGLLRREVTVETPSQAIKTTTSAVNLVVISVTDTKKVRAAAAANALAEVLLERIGGDVELHVRPTGRVGDCRFVQKPGLLDLLGGQQHQLGLLNGRLDGFLFGGGCLHDG